jgi:hypothetical protein
MGDLGNNWTLNDYTNAKYAWLATIQKDHRKVIVYKFIDYQTEGNQCNPNETLRLPTYGKRLDSIWLSMVKVYDTVKGGYFTTGDINVYSEFLVQGYSPAYTTADGNVIPEYAGDLIEWNGKLWAVADMLEPIQWGFLSKQVFYCTIMRKTQRTSIGVKIGP